MLYLMPCPLHEYSAVVAKPLIPLPVLRKHPEDFIIEFLRVVHLLEVTKLMNNDCVYDFRRRQHQKTIKVQIAFAAAAAPFCFLFSYCNSAGFNSYERRVVSHSSRYVFLRPCGEPGNILFAEKPCPDRPLLFPFQSFHSLLDPAFCRSNGPLDFSGACSLGRTNQHPVCSHFDADCSASAAFDCIGNI